MTEGVDAVFSIAKEHAPEKEEMRKVYCDALISEAEKNPNIVSVDADVMNSLGTVGFHKRFPERAINCGIQEARAVRQRFHSFLSYIQCVCNETSL